jgi:hypothetical protein
LVVPPHSAARSGATHRLLLWLLWLLWLLLLLLLLWWRWGVGGVEQAPRDAILTGISLCFGGSDGRPESRQHTEDQARLASAEDTQRRHVLRGESAGHVTGPRSAHGHDGRRLAQPLPAAGERPSRARGPPILQGVHGCAAQGQQPGT